MTAIFVTGTGTDVGKTFIAAGLIQHLRATGRNVDAIKPVASGFDPGAATTSDPGLLLAALGQPVTDKEIERIAPWRYAAPMSPDLAAAREGKRIDFAELVAFTRRAVAAASNNILLIEGIGGVMVPLDETHTVLDWIAALRIPVLLVAGSYLGTISHTLTALRALASVRIEPAAVIVSESATSTTTLGDTVATIARFAGQADVIGVPRDAEDVNHPAFARIAARL